ncbi:hypothetical protein LMG29542_06445 [Paraburkholderia humisilvae]|uniref:Uncharacterized protein n=1 Tax=Paraburkholderia humisilvae TaxID=627669 RepID=A0A6J5EW48_9BURK|nr:hypothetical protein LMG29542_06445 [Paraburkholderia humisilvae]
MSCARFAHCYPPILWITRGNPHLHELLKARLPVAHEGQDLIDPILTRVSAPEVKESGVNV